MLIFYCARSSDMIYYFLYCVIPRHTSAVEPAARAGYGNRNQEEEQRMKKGFDNDKYLQMQSEHIRERIAQFDNKLYLEFGGQAVR